MSKHVSDFIKRVFNRPQPKMSLMGCFKMGIKALVTITLLGIVGYLTGLPLVIAPFAASCITIYTAPKEEFAQPMNVIGGYFIASLLGVIMVTYLPYHWLILGFILSITISFMAFFRVTHPPAGAIPFIMYFYHQENAQTAILIPAILGSFGVVVSALVLNNLSFCKREYPKKID
jgi:CBS-domain-containing membrane protein